MTRINLGWYGFLVALALLPTALPGVFTNGFDVHVMILVLLYASMAQAWNLIGGYGGQVSFGHSVFFGLGAYGAAMALVTYHGSPWVGALVGSLVAAGAAVIISYP
ncbi:MAG TPA: branched-chain amino acid ABC transporter permease, partial [Synergistaceae bacterium]|nr:branched-chain amino acid ABC transporter permease [Synergistaceae bacterium]